MTALPLVEAAYLLIDSERDFLSELSKAAIESFSSVGMVAAFSYGQDQRLNTATCAVQRSDERFINGIATMSAGMNDADFAAMYFGPPSLIDPMSQTPPEQARVARKLEVHQTMGLMGATGGESAIGVAFTVADRDAWTRKYRAYLSDVASHLATAWRLRSALTKRTATKVAEYHADGREIEAEGAASTPSMRELLREAVRSRETIRRGGRKPDATNLWPSLIAGRWTIIDEYEASGSRRVVAYENSATVRHVRALSERQATVLQHVVAGRSGKWIAAEMSLSQSAISRALQSAFQSLGVRRLTTLFSLLAASGCESISFAGHPFSVFSTECVEAERHEGLTPAESSVLSHLLRGRPAHEIASLRGVSLRTVRNQEASLYQKLGVSSLRELLLWAQQYLLSTI